MRLSILDQAPISSSQTAHDAFNDSLKLAQAGEKQPQVIVTVSILCAETTEKVEKLFKKAA
nr:hypothetical protein [Alkalihalobacillus deserti]